MQPQRQQNLKPRALLSTMIKNRTPVNDQTPHFMAQSNGPPPNQGQMVPGGPPGTGPGTQQIVKRGQMLMQRPMRPRQSQQGQPQMNLPPQNQMQNPHPQMYQIQHNNQVMNQNVSVQNSMHHMPQQQSQPNYGGPPPNMVYANSMQMGNMDQQTINQGHPGINQSPYQQQQQQQVNPQILFRNQQMHHQSGHHPGQPTMGPPQGQQQGAGQPVAQQQTHHTQQYLQGPGPGQGQMSMQGMQNMHW